MARTKARRAKKGGPVTKASGGVTQPVVVRHKVPSKSEHLTQMSAQAFRAGQTRNFSPSSGRRGDFVDTALSGGSRRAVPDSGSKDAPQPASFRETQQADRDRTKELISTLFKEVDELKRNGQFIQTEEPRPQTTNQKRAFEETVETFSGKKEAHAHTGVTVTLEASMRRSHASPQPEVRDEDVIHPHLRHTEYL